MGRLSTIVRSSGTVSTTQNIWPRMFLNTLGSPTISPLLRTAHISTPITNHLSTIRTSVSDPLLLRSIPQHTRPYRFQRYYYNVGQQKMEFSGMLPTPYTFCVRRRPIIKTKIGETFIHAPRGRYFSSKKQDGSENNEGILDLCLQIIKRYYPAQIRQRLKEGVKKIDKVNFLFNSLTNFF